MNIDKSLYMKDFLELRNNLGSVHNSEAKHILYTNLYNDFLPKEIKKKVETVVEEIEEKTILIKDKKNVLFEDLPDENVPKDVIQELPKEIIIDDTDENDTSDPIFQNMDELKKKEQGGGYNQLQPSPLDGSGIDSMGGGRKLKKNSNQS